MATYGVKFSNTKRTMEEIWAKEESASVGAKENVPQNEAQPKPLDTLKYVPYKTYTDHKLHLHHGIDQFTLDDIRYITYYKP